MKKRIMAIMAIMAATVAATALSVPLTGCGSKAAATDATVESSVIVSEEALETGAEGSEAASEGAEASEADSDEKEAASGMEDENVVLYAKRGSQDYVPLSGDPYEENVKTFTSQDTEIPLYDGDGFNVGHVKAGRSIVATENSGEAAWSRFKNPIEGTPYDYLYVSNEYMHVEKYFISADEMKAKIIKHIVTTTGGGENIVFLDEPTSDMEVYGFVVANDRIEGETDMELWLALYGKEASPLQSNRYGTLHVECQEDEDGEPYVRCKLYYKDPMES